MVLTSEIRGAVGAVRACSSNVVQRNGLEAGVLAGWLTAVERELENKPLDWMSLAICLQVIDRWIQPMEELHEVHEVFERIIGGGAADPLGLERWFCPSPQIPGASEIGV